MEIKSSTYIAPVVQNTKPETIKQVAEEITKSIPSKWQDDIVTLSSTGGGHPERPPKESTESASVTLQNNIASLSTSDGSHPDRPPEPKPETPPKT